MNTPRKFCRQCEQEKDSSNFYSNVRAKDKLQSWCKDCAKAYSKTPVAKNSRAKYESSAHRKEGEARRRRALSSLPENKQKARLYLIKKNYGISPDKYIELLDSFREKGCPICGRTDGPVHVDHDHSCCSGHKSCGRCVRGILCPKCNVVLGMAEDKVETLQRAVKYLQGE